MERHTPHSPAVATAQAASRRAPTNAVVLARALLVIGMALAGLVALGWAGIALLVVVTDPASDTSGSDNGIGIDDYVGVVLLFASGLALLFGAGLAATARAAWSVWPIAGAAIAMGLVALSLF
jgi:hypothetical protein